jgi:hypothetical protein
MLSHDYTLFTYEDLATVLMRRNNGAEDNMTGDVKDRVNRHLARSLAVWNNFPGSLSILQEYSTSMSQYPFYYG